MAALIQKSKAREYDMVMIGGVMANVEDEIRANYNGTWRCGKIEKIVGNYNGTRILVNTQKGYRWLFVSGLKNVEIRSNFLVDD